MTNSRQTFELSQGLVDLLPPELPDQLSTSVKRDLFTYCNPMLALWNWWSRSLFLKEEPGKTENDPVHVGEHQGVLIYERVIRKRQEDRQIQCESDDISPLHV